MSALVTTSPMGLDEGFGQRFCGPGFAEGLDGAVGVEGERTHGRQCMAGRADPSTAESGRKVWFESAVCRCRHVRSVLLHEPVRC